MENFEATSDFFVAARYVRNLEYLADDFFKPTGLLPVYSYVILAIDDVSSKSIDTLAQRLGFTRKGMCCAVDKLKRCEFVEYIDSDPHSEDGDVYLRLTPAGKEFIDTAHHYVNDWENLTEKQLGNQKEAMIRLLQGNEEKLKAIAIDDSRL